MPNVISFSRPVNVEYQHTEGFFTVLDTVDVPTAYVKDTAAYTDFITAKLGTFFWWHDNYERNSRP